MTARLAHGITWQSGPWPGGPILSGLVEGACPHDGVSAVFKFKMHRLYGATSTHLAPYMCKSVKVEGSTRCMRVPGQMVPPPQPSTRKGRRYFSQPSGLSPFCGRTRRIRASRANLQTMKIFSRHGRAGVASQPQRPGRPIG